MHFHVLTLFPEMVLSGLNTSILARAQAKGLIEIRALNIRDYTNSRHGKVDDYIYGGGAGLLMQAQPVYDCWKAAQAQIRARKKECAAISGGEGTETVPTGQEPFSARAQIDPAEDRTRVVYLTPVGRTFDQKMAQDFSREEDLILLCGHYEGIDERVIEEIVTDPVSIGDFVVTGGELPAMVIIDAVSRLLPGVLGNDGSASTDSFQNGLLEYPQYSRPEEWNGREVPPVLLSGDHAKVDAWRLGRSLERTRQLRPDLYDAWVLQHGQPEDGEKSGTAP